MIFIGKMKPKTLRYCRRKLGSWMRISTVFYLVKRLVKIKNLVFNRLPDSGRFECVIGEEAKNRGGNHEEKP